MLRADGVTVVPPGRERPLCTDATLVLYPGDVVVLTGRTGSGKTSLLRALAGLPPAGSRCTGRVVAGDRALVLLQDVEGQLLFTTVADEVASGPRAAGAAEEQTRDRVAAALAQVGLTGFGPRSVDALSAGEQQRVVLAALLALEPRVLLLDEPTSALDEAGRARLVEILAGLRARGTAIVIADHRTLPFTPLAPRRVHLEAGALRIVHDKRPAAEDLPPGAAPRPARRTGEGVLHCRSLSVEDAAGRRLVSDFTLSLGRGERVLLTGPNGCGKSTLLRTFAGLLRPATGTLSVHAGSAAQGRPGLGGVGLLFQSPERNLFERTVRDEVGFVLRRAGLRGPALERRLDDVLDRCDLGDLAERSPLRLSFGEQHRVALASVIAPEPGLLLLDEPFAGLDADARRSLLGLLAREQERTGCAIVIASHDTSPLDRFAHRTLALAAHAAPGAGVSR